MRSDAVVNLNCVVRYKGLSISRVTKCGTTSISNALLSVAGDFASLNLCNPSEAPEGTISFIRDPYARTLSAWADKLKTPDDTIGQKNLIALGFPVGDFAGFVRLLPKLHAFNVHTIPQAQFYRPDFTIYRLGQIGEVWEALMEQYDWLPKLSHDRKTGLNVEDFYTDELRKIVRDIYAGDFYIRDKI